MRHGPQVDLPAMGLPRYAAVAQAQEKLSQHVGDRVTNSRNDQGDKDADACLQFEAP